MCSTNPRDLADWLFAALSHWWSKCLARVAAAVVGHTHLLFVSLASGGKIINPFVVLLQRDESANTLLTLLKRTGADGVTQSASAASLLCSPSPCCLYRHNSTCSKPQRMRQLIGREPHTPPTRPSPSAR